MTNTENFERLLSENGVEESIISCVIVLHWTSVAKEGVLTPPGTGPEFCVWLHTDDGDYFLQRKVNLNDPHDTSFSFDFFTLEDYVRKYG